MINCVVNSNQASKMQKNFKSLSYGYKTPQKPHFTCFLHFLISPFHLVGWKIAWRIPIKCQKWEKIIHFSAMAKKNLKIGFLMFLDASSHLYERVCPSVRWSVRRSIRWSVRRSVGHTLLFLVFAVFGLTAPAQIMKWPKIQPLPTRARLG